MIQDMDTLPWVADVYKRDLQIEKYFIGYLLHPYISHVHRPRLPGAMHLLPLAADHRRPQIPRPLAAERRRRNGLHEENLPAGARIFLRRRHLHREPAARPRNRQEARPARRPLELQQPREPGLRHDKIFQGQRPAPVPRRLRKRQRRHSHAHQKRRDDGRDAPVHEGLPPGRRGDSRHVHPRPAGRDDSRPSRTRSILRRNWTCSACRFRSPRRIRARSFTKWPSRTAGS